MVWRSQEYVTASGSIPDIVFHWTGLNSVNGIDFGVFFMVHGIGFNYLAVPAVQPAYACHK